MSKEVDEQEVDEIVIEIMDLNREYILRTNRPDGKNNPKLVKAYFRKLYSDWQTAMDKKLKEIDEI
jgi:hypothetical protein